MLRLPLPKIPSKDEMKTVQEFEKEYPFADQQDLPPCTISFTVRDDKYIWISRPKFGIREMVFERNEDGFWDYGLGNDIRFIFSDTRSKQIENIKIALSFGIIEPKPIIIFLFLCAKRMIPVEIILHIISFIRTIYLNQLNQRLISSS